MFNENATIEPMDTCGCGDIGYLTARIVPIDLAHGVGRVTNVPVYHCRSTYCQEFTLPAIVSRRLEAIAEEMEETQTTETTYTWENRSTTPKDLIPKPAHALVPAIDDEIPLQAFTLQFVNRQYEDARVVQIVPGQAVFFQSKLEETEYYLLRYEEDTRNEGTWFSFSKFYYVEPNFTYEDFLEWSEDGHLKELGRITLDEAEDMLIDEFGDW